MGKVFNERARARNGKKEKRFRGAIFTHQRENLL